MQKVPRGTATVEQGEWGEVGIRVSEVDAHPGDLPFDGDENYLVPADIWHRARALLRGEDE